MNDARLPTFLYVFLLVLGLLQWAHVYPQLPDVMASHFSGHGTPNAWQPKPAFFRVDGIVIPVTAVPTFVVPRRLPSMPPDKINLPNKSYWLAPERREATFCFVRTQMAWFGCALLFVLLYATSASHQRESSEHRPLRLAGNVVRARRIPALLHRVESFFGPNMTTFVLPSELYPVTMRTTGHGISAGHRQARRLHRGLPVPGAAASLGLRGTLLLTAGVAVSGFALTFVLPEPAGRSLEDIAIGTPAMADTGARPLLIADQPSAP